MSSAHALARCPHCGEDHDEDALRCPATDMMLPLEGRRLDEKFRFLSALGTGGMASVYLAVNERVDREVAIKFLRPEVARDSEAVARFRSEARAAGRIGNRHICEILDLGDSPIGPYIVMERLRGVDLADLIRQQTRLQPGYAVRVVRHALEGLAAAHEAGIVHRDLKPGNIFLHRDHHGDTIVKLMDFGVSKFLDGSNEAQTASGILLGTPEYMAPEQLEGAHKIGPAADIFAMGAILYRAISGRHVFAGENLAAVLRAMALDEVTPLSRFVEGLPEGLEAIIHRCLARDIEARYQTTAELSEALAPFEVFEGEVTPIVEPPQTREIESNMVIEAGASPPPPPPPAAPVKPPAPSGGTAGDVSATAAAGAVEAQPAPARSNTGLKLVLAVVVSAALAFLAARLLMDEPAPAKQPTPDAGAAVDGGSETGELGDVPADLGGAADAGLLELHGAGGTETGGTETGGTEAGETETGGTEGGRINAYVSGAERSPPSGTFRAGAYISPNEPSGTTDLAGAIDYCEKLAAQSYAGQSDWKLANPAELAKFIGNSTVKRARYWTTALHKGRAWTYTLPKGSKSSDKASTRRARALCVTKY